MRNTICETRFIRYNHKSRDDLTKLWLVFLRITIHIYLILRAISSGDSSLPNLFAGVKYHSIVESVNGSGMRIQAIESNSQIVAELGDTLE